MKNLGRQAEENQKERKKADGEVEVSEWQAPRQIGLNQRVNDALQAHNQLSKGGGISESRNQAGDVGSGTNKQQQIARQAWMSSVWILNIPGRLPGP